VRISTLFGCSQLGSESRNWKRTPNSTVCFVLVFGPGNGDPIPRPPRPGSPPVDSNSEPPTSELNWKRSVPHPHVPLCLARENPRPRGIRPPVPPSSPLLAGKLPPQFIPSSYHPHPHPLYLRCPRSGGGPSPSSPTPSRPPVLNLGGTRVSAAGICTTRQRTQDSLLHVKERTSYAGLRSH
jgi:hypothetical protein